MWFTYTESSGIMWISAASSIEAIAQLITLILIFAFVIGLSYFATRIVGNVQKEKLKGSNIKILETMRISNTKYIQVVEIGDKCFAIAVCKDTVTYLCELNADELVYTDSSNSVIKGESFKAVLDKFKKDKPDDKAE